LRFALRVDRLLAAPVELVFSLLPVLFATLLTLAASVDDLE
jgi:hypothetical protein